MISLATLESILVDIHPYALAVLTLGFTLLVLTGGTEMFDSVINYLWHPSSHGSSTSKQSHKGRPDAPRTRAQQVAARKDETVAPYAKPEACHYSGLVNMSGTYCFLNSPLQVRLMCVVSLSALKLYGFRH